MSHGRSCVCRLTFKERTTHFYPQLQTICRARRIRKRDLLENVDKCLLCYICDCSQGVLRRFVRFPSAAYKKLKPYKNALLLLANRRVSAKQKRSTVATQGGGFLSILLPALATIAGEIFGKYLFPK